MNRWKCVVLVILPLVMATAAGAAPLKIDMGPTLGDLTPNSALLTWHTNEPATGWLEIAGQKIGAGELVHTHRVRVRGLEPGRTYWYTVKAKAGDESDSIGPHRLKTPPASLAIWTFAAYGDTRTRPAHHRRVVTAMLTVRPRLILHTGDLVGDGCVLDHWQHFFPVIGVFSQNLPFYPCIGNHERNSPLYYELLPLSSGGGDGGSEWYSFRFGNCQFYALDSCRHIGEQTEWLRSQLAQSRPAGVDWRIVIFHHPPFSSGPHGSNQTLQEQWCPLLEDNGVDLVFCGHDHIYEHSLHGGVHYVTLGTGGAPLYEPGVNPNSYSQFAISCLGFSRVEVTREQLTVTFFDDGSQILEQFTVIHYPPAGTSGGTEEGIGMAQPEVVAVGELIVEIMRKGVDSPLNQPGDFVGPFPSGAPAIFADQVARLGHSSGFIGAVGKDDFGKCLLSRFEADGVDTSQVAEIEGLSTGVAFVTYFADGSRRFIYHIDNSALKLTWASDQRFGS